MKERIYKVKQENYISHWYLRRDK